MTNEESSTPAPQEAKTDKDATAEEISAPPEAVNMTDEEELGAANDKDNSDSGKLKALLNILRRMLGVKDLAAIRLSLPANLLEPVPNLEYWNYLDRGDLFTTIGDFQDPLDRMLAVLRFTLTKELKFVHGKICKPYNSILGEHFRCHWDVQAPDINEKGDLIPKMALRTSNPTSLHLANSTGALASKPKKKLLQSSSTTSSTSEEGVHKSSSLNKIASGGSTNNNSTNSSSNNNNTDTSDMSKTRKGLSKILLSARSIKSSNSVTTDSTSQSTQKSPAPSVKSPALSAKEDQGTIEEEGADDGASVSGSFKTTKSNSESTRRITFLTEQVSHHPPISSFWVECKEAGVELYGVDQLSAKFTGTSVRIFPGEYNQGIFARLNANAKCGVEGEEYQITHPTASINGLLRGSLWVAISDTLYLTCRGGKRGDDDNGTRLRSIVEYKDESWVMKAKYALEAVIYEYEEGKEDEYEKIKLIPQDKILVTIEGTWKGQVTWKKKGDKDSRMLIDLDQLGCISPKSVRPLDIQDEMESRKIWKPVTEAICNKEFSAATKHKQDIEQKQRETAAERKRKGHEFKPQFFNADISNGRPTLTEAGREALDGELNRTGPDDDATPTPTK